MSCILFLHEHIIIITALLYNVFIIMYVCCSLLWMGAWNKFLGSFNLPSKIWIWCQMDEMKNFENGIPMSGTNGERILCITSHVFLIFLLLSILVDVLSHF